MTPQRTQIIAHRGASGLVPVANTMESFEKAVDVGAPMFEFDIRRTKDGELVAFHDDDIDGRKLNTLSLAELQSLAGDKGFKVPRVEDILQRFTGRIRFDIELKEAGYEADIQELIHGYLRPEQYVVKSFLDEVVLKMKTLDPRNRAGLLLGKDKPSNVIRTRASELYPELRLGRCQADFVSPHFKLLRMGFIKRMRMLGLGVYVWTVNEPDLMRQLIAQNVYAIITDHPDIALNMLPKASSAA